MTVQSLWERTVLVIPIRVGLGIAWLVAARIAGAGSAPALLAFVVGTFGLMFAALNDPRSRLVHGEVEPLELPATATVAPHWRQGVAASFPSTVGVSILAAIAVVPQPVLAALLGGASAGLGLAALVSLPRIDRALFVDARSRVIYRR